MITGPVAAVVAIFGRLSLDPNLFLIVSNFTRCAREKGVERPNFLQSWLVIF